MPKTTKKSSTSRAKKASPLKRKFDLTSRKVQFFVAIIIVAILGAGYFTFKSFAATNTASYSFTNVTNFYSTGWGCNAASNTKYISESSKNGNKVFVLPSANYCAGSKQNVYLSTLANYRVCATVKGKGSVLFPSFAPNTPVSVYSPDKYSNVCSNYTVQPPSSDKKIVVRLVSGGPLNVSILSLERGGEAINSNTPSPAK